MRFFKCSSGMHANPEKLHLLMLLFLLMFSPSGSLASAKWNGSKIFKWDMHEKATQSELQCSICERVTYRFGKSYVLTRLDIRAYVLYMLCVCVCVCGAMCTRGTQWTSEQWGLCGRGGRFVHSILLSLSLVCVSVQDTEKDKCVYACVCASVWDVERPTKQRDKGKWHETGDKR